MTAPPYRSHALDGLRGIAAVSVIFYHSILHHEVLVQTVLPVPIQDLSGWGNWMLKIALSAVHGNNAVLLFFVLSGFVLNLSLNRMQGTSVSISLRFIIRRVMRLYPALIFCMACYYALSVVYSASGWQGVTPPDLGKAIINASLWDITWHGPSRTIQAEMLAAPFLLAVFFISRWLGVAGLLLALSYSMFGFEQPWLVLNAPNMNAWLMAFVVGMVVADSRLSRFFTGISGSALALLCLSFVFLRIVTNMNHASSTFGQIAMAGALVGAVYYSDPKTAIIRFLNWAPIAYLGKISYSLYLLNVLWLLVVWSIVDRWGVYPDHPLATGIMVGVVVTALTIPLAHFSEKWFEQGGATLGAFLTRSKPPRLSDPATQAAS